jgi:guanylate kinase
MSNIFIISGPSGSGQDSVIKELKGEFELDKIITTTTRKMRPEDQEGVSYYFISKEAFKKGIEENKFFEYALEDNGNYYGGTFSELERVKKSKKPVIWKIDYKGVLNAKKIIPEAKSILIHIPIELIRSRLEKRGESPETITSRIEYSRGWYNNENIFDYKITNEEGKLEKTVKQVAKIIKNNLDAQFN